jgi:hypothetical protein
MVGRFEAGRSVGVGGGVGLGRTSTSLLSSAATPLKQPNHSRDGVGEFNLGSIRLSCVGSGVEVGAGVGGKG